jgi:hypothetical protein
MNNAMAFAPFLPEGVVCFDPWEKYPAAFV